MTDEAYSDEYAALRRQAMDRLARREHSRQELAAKVAKAGTEESIVAQVLDDLADEGLQSDARYAQALVTHKSGKGQGPIRIAAELKQAGVAETLVEQTLAEAGVDWTDQARKTRHKRFGEAVPTDYSTKARQMRFLQRRGFNMDQITAAFEPGDFSA